MLNVLDLILLCLTFSIVFLGSLITNYEKHLPISLLKLYKCGSYGHKAHAGKLLDLIEIPKYYYRHFYIFATIFSSFCLVYMSMVYFMRYQVNKYVTVALEGIFLQNEPAVSASGALVALSLTTMHCARRCWETHYLQVFSIGSKMNFLHYGAALVHYATLILAIVGQAPLFCGNQNRQFLWKDGRPKTLYATCILVFLVASYEQYKSNVILANLRKSKKTGAVITEEHGIPRGRMFQMISSPHRLCEIVLYFVIAALIPTRTMIIMSFWVFCNQIQSSVHAHEWYKKTFKNYPKSRHALLPYII